MKDDLRPKERFSGLADIYAKARPDYPDQAIDFILEHCQLKPGALLVDIGCGTGIASRAFSRRGLQVIGVEPNEDMRKQAQLANSGQDLQSPIYQAGSAEHAGLESQLAEAIVCAQAFHWFDAEKALAEFARILKPGGWIILIWNLLNELHPATKRYCGLIRKYGDVKDRATMSIEAGMEKTGSKLFESQLFIKKEKFVFANEQALDEEGLINRAFSVSYAPKEADAKEMLIDGLKQLFEDEQEKGTIFLKYNLELYVACRP